MSVCLTSVYYRAYRSKSRTERPRKIKIDTEVAHVRVTRPSLSGSKGQRSRSPGRFAHRRVRASGGCRGGRGNMLAMGNCCYVACARRRKALRRRRREERGAAYRGGRPPNSFLFLQSTTAIGCKLSLIVNTC